MAQLVARSVRDAEVVGSSPITQTILLSGVGAVVARTSGGREVASSILVPPTISFLLYVAILSLAIVFFFNIVWF